MHNDNSDLDMGPVLGSGDFLADQGYANPDEARLKFKLANQIALVVEEKKLRYDSDVLKITNGNVSKYTVPNLKAILEKLNKD